VFDVHRIDFLAPKAGQNEWFLKLVPTLETAYPDMHVESYPGLAFAKALVLRNMEDEKKEVSSTVLRAKLDTHALSRI
jgi:hypothetical protein